MLGDKQVWRMVPLVREMHQGSDPFQFKLQTEYVVDRYRNEVIYIYCVWMGV